MKNWVAANSGGGVYFEWTQGEQISEFIKSQPAGEPINLFGHSYGGDTAAWAVLNSDRKIDSLTTLDPVSRIKPDFGRVACKVGKWTNVAANPSKSDRSDFIAALGGKWGNGPIGSASIHIPVDLNHANFPGMMKAAGF